MRRLEKIRRPTNLLSDRDPKELVLTYAGNVVKHLGVQMYAGRPVPAIAELISNAWDADAATVNVRLPLNKPWKPNRSDDVIEVSDDGNGMTWDMVRDAYLDVGRDRREAENTDRSPGGRLVQGRKGVGKLAGFGIADVLEVQTVFTKKHPTLGKRVLLWFRLDLDDLKDKQRAPVQLLFAGPVDKAPHGARTTRGTTITLRRLHARRAQNVDRFHHAMAQRFLLIGPRFRVRLNGEDLRAEKIKLQWRWPKAGNGWATDNVEGCGPVSYWIGFTKQPRKQNEGELSGLLIYTREKISQEATFFDISGGVTGQHGLRYMVGMVRAPWLDAGIQEPDLIATHRGAIAWESPQGVAFQAWGQRLVRDHLKKWAQLRAKARVTHVTSLTSQVKARIAKLSPAYKQHALRFLEKFQNVEMEAEEFEDILSWFVDALENATLRSILQKLRDSDAADLAELDDLLCKMEVRTAVTLLQIIDSNLTAIETLEKMHHEDAKERGVLSKHLQQNPWLIDPTWMLNKAEARVATWIRSEFGLQERGDPGDDDRADFFCVAVGGTLHIVEIKRGGHIATSADVEQANKYRKYVEKRFKEMSETNAIKYSHVQSHLIAAQLHEDAEDIKRAYGDHGWVMFTCWDDLVERAKYTHVQFRDALERRISDEDEDALVDDEAPAAKKSLRRRTAKQAKKKKRK